MLSGRAGSIRKRDIAYLTSVLSRPENTQTKRKDSVLETNETGSIAMATTPTCETWTALLTQLFAPRSLSFLSPYPPTAAPLRVIIYIIVIVLHLLPFLLRLFFSASSSPPRRRSSSSFRTSGPHRRFLPVTGASIILENGHACPTLRSYLPPSLFFFLSFPPLVHRVPSPRLIISALIGSEEFRVG